ncbi:helix-turn-helix transcriptional regulator [Nguyenibacter vanlangensis]|uniref:Helix-turn-helix transcriptional regulator n=1 Tax=Nguyenibacter vanlangensis TaxID=1216886 RepID=A0A7Y7M4E2_9PROT|nr:LuxR C-terminal-related transcriptional regulator [Nguyenibacter vanlangensis]NVN09892.1 helix-turn-helix transcriptional regulator [Nguyenibacter vanlangensis]
MIAMPGSCAWFQQAGTAAASIGSDIFYVHLLSLLGLVVQHCSTWIITYSDQNPPDVFHTAGVTKRTLTSYCRDFYEVDPFWQVSRLCRDAEVLTLETLDPSVKNARYTEAFRSDAGFRDELGVLLPSTSGRAVSLFLQHDARMFSPRDIAAVRKVMPLIVGMHRAHLSTRTDRRPVPPSYPPSRAGDDAHDPWSDLATRLTPREQDLIALIMRGRNTGEIAQALQISKGTVKNYRLRLYRKANVTSERALVSTLQRTGMF